MSHIRLRILALWKSVKFTPELLVTISFVFYFSSDLIHTGYNWVFRLLENENLTVILTIATIYVPLLIAVIAEPKKYVKLDFLALLAFVAGFFGLSLAIHPEYLYWYSRPDYGVYNYVLIPTEGLYAYLFVRLLNDPDKIRKNVKIAGWLMLLSFGYDLYLYLIRGYWIGVGGLNGSYQMDHSVSFGYEVLFFALFFIYDAVQDKKWMDIVGGIIYLSMVLFGGARGPILCAGVFLVLLGLTCFRFKTLSPQKVAVALGILAAGFVLCQVGNQVQTMLGGLAEVPGSSSGDRVMSSLVDGTFVSNNGRFKIWRAAVDMILQNPWGHGAMGSQPVISNIIYAGYPHCIILEILIDFGVIVESAILIFLAWQGLSFLFFKKDEKWTGVFLIFVGTACQLFISLCFWSSPAFWAAVGTGVCYALSLKRQKETEQAEAPPAKRTVS